MSNENLGLLKQLQTKDPTSPANSFMALLQGWSDWRATQGVGSENPEPTDVGGVGGMMKEPHKHALVGLLKWLEGNTDKAMRPSGAVAKQPGVSETLLKHELLTPEKYAADVTKEAAKTWTQGYRHRPNMTVEGQFAVPVYPHRPDLSGFKDSIKPLWDLPRRAERDPEKFQTVQDGRLLELLREVLGKPR